MDSKLSGSNNISYQGMVTIESISTTTKKVTRRIQNHNAGELPFFEAIAMCISGKDWSKYMPRYLCGFDASGKQTISSYIPYNLPVVTTKENSASVRFEFLIPFTQLSTTSVTTTLKLYNTTGPEAKPFASIEVPVDPNDANKNLIGGEDKNHLVMWTITIGNK